MAESNDSFAALLAQEEQSPLTRLKTGEKTTAIVAGISGESIFLDVGGKSEGLLNSSEVIDEEGNITLQPGDKIDVYYLKSQSGGDIFTIKIGSSSSADHLEEAWRSGIPIEGVVKEEIKGGFEITLGGKIRAFCPYSQMGLRRIDNAGEEYLETTMTFLISRFEESGRNIVLSARAIQEQEREKLKESLKTTLEEGQTLEGVVTSIRDFGAFVDIGGVDGLIPISEIGWARVEKVEDHFTIGQKIQAVIKRLDWENDRIALSYKETLQNPWQAAEKDFAAGSTHTGNVVRLAPFGAFINLAEGIDGLVHISKLGKGRRINHPREVVEVGQDIDVTIESFDTENQKISLTPSDYVSEASKEEQEHSEFKSFKNKKEKKSDSGMGSLGALLQKKLAEKNK